MVGQRVLTQPASLDRRGFLALVAAAGAVAVLPRALRAAPVPAAVWRVQAWTGLVGRRLRLADGGAVRLLEVLDHGWSGGPGRFSLLLDPLADEVGEGIHTVLHPQLGPVLLGTTWTGSPGRLLVVVDHATAPDQRQRHV